MNRDELAKIARKSGNVTALKTALRAHFKTEKGKAALADAPPVYGSGLPRPMGVDDAIASLVEEAAPFLPKPKKVKR